MTDKSELISQLDSFDPRTRNDALRTLATDFASDLAETGSDINMHFHSFFSYNAENYSPSHLAWAARERGLYAAGLCDFDVLDGLEEFLAAGRLLGLRATVNLETRAYVKDMAAVDISSPGEPGVSYVMGAGFVCKPAGGTPQARELAKYRDGARQRNLALIARINPHIPDIALDYEPDVLPLTPAGVATERHIVSAYIRKAREVFPHATDTAGFWARLLCIDMEEAASLLADTPALEEKVRSRLAKRGGLGYEQPSDNTFPPVADFMAWVAACGAIPMTAWLDGTSGGESDPDAYLDCMCAHGAAAINIIPDRNWNIADANVRAAKVAHLNAVVAAAQRRNLPINIGTEMNKGGLPFVDDLRVEALRPHRETFLQGARIMVGHTLLLRYAGISYAGPKAQAEFPDVATRNERFAQVGALPPLTVDDAEALEQMGPERAYRNLMERTEAG